MSTDSHKQTHGFQTEISQLLDLMIHSLYSNKEIFLRELISNGADAIDRLRFEALTDDGLYEGDSELKIRIVIDNAARTLCVMDNGIGMSRDEIVDNLGTIAKSGTQQFFDSLTGDQSRDAQLIGQFGVGFYSSFIVSDRVLVTTRRAGLSAAQGVRWESTGDGQFTVEDAEVPARGTTVLLHFREDQEEFSDEFKVRQIIRRYSDHISVPVVMVAPNPITDLTADADNNETENAGETEVEETINQATALWTRNKADIGADEYKEFYKHIAHDFEDPMDWIHSRIEGKLEYASLLYIPTRAPFDLWDRNIRRGIKLYVRRVFIMDDAEQLMPPYLRFVRGVIDSADLPLNVSRELLQKNQQIDSIRAGSVKKILDLIARIAKDDTERYAGFWEQFGRVLKEGILDDAANRDAIAKLLRFASTHEPGGKQSVSLSQYIERMQQGQKRIYYITADNDLTARNSPHLEHYRDRGIEVLLLTDPIDEWVVSELTEFDSKPLQSVAKGLLEEDTDDKDQASDADTDNEAGGDREDESDSPADSEMLQRIHEALGDRVKHVRASKRLIRSPACLVVDEHEMGARMQRILKSVGQDIAGAKPILEINTQHPLVQRLQQEDDQDRCSEWAQLLFDQAILSEGGRLEDPAGFVQRMNDMVLNLVQQSTAPAAENKADPE